MSSFPDKLLISCRQKKKGARKERTSIEGDAVLLNARSEDGEQGNNVKTARKMCFKADLAVCPRGVQNPALCSVCLPARVQPLLQAEVNNLTIQSHSPSVNRRQEQQVVWPIGVPQSRKRGGKGGEEKGRRKKGQKLRLIVAFQPSFLVSLIPAFFCFILQSWQSCG